jgi:hypothetical protein
MAWHNADGLYIQYGTEQSDAKRAGEYKTVDNVHVTEFDLDLTVLTTSNTIIDDTVQLDAGVTVLEVQVICTEVATTASSAVLNVGLIRTDRSTAYDADGLVEAAAVTTIDARGETTIYRAPVSGTAVGDLVGTVLANTGLLVASTSTGTFTDGTVKVRILWAKI